MKQDNIPTRCRDCWNFSGSYCDVHQHMIDDCKKWSPKSKDCRMYGNGTCYRSDVESMDCIGKDNCGAYEPKPKTKLTTAYVKLTMDGTIHGITKIRTFANGEKLFFLDNGGMYSARDLEFNQPIPESDLRISVAHLREILTDMAMDCNEYRPKPTIARTVDEIIERVKEEI